MNTKIAFSIVSVALAAFIITGCKSKPPVKYVESLNPPAMGTAGKTDIPTFIEGRWGIKEEVDPNMSKMMGLDSVKKEVESEPLRNYFQFEKGGTFKAKLTVAKNTFKGKWSVNGEMLTLTWETLNDKPLADLKKQTDAAANGGTAVGIQEQYMYENIEGVIKQLVSFRLSNDKVKWILQAPNLSGQVTDSSTFLVRMEQEKTE